MVHQKLVTQDKISKRYYIVPEALNKTLISKDIIREVTKLFSEFYFIIIKALNSKNLN